MCLATQMHSLFGGALARAKKRIWMFQDDMCKRVNKVVQNDPEGFARTPGETYSSEFS